MSDFELVLVGAVIAFLVYFGWQQRNSIMIYLTAGSLGIYGVTTDVSREAPYAITIAIVLGLAGFVLDKSRG